MFFEDIIKYSETPKVVMCGIISVLLFVLFTSIVIYGIAQQEDARYTSSTINIQSLRIE